MIRGEIYRLAPPPGGDPKRARCYVVVSRQTLLDSKADKVVCAPVNTTFVGLETQLPAGVAEGLKHSSCVNCDQLLLIDKGRLTNFVGSLSAEKLRGLRRALRVALDVE
ncbi:MAG: type II toxin-antitoxin system PemK/MazF family toxin [Gemmatimonadales bacterium]|nr:type II toxin-antitoxin system PemK/MazF family toxin [Gemmatimonadales bacterium]